MMLELTIPNDESITKLIPKKLTHLRYYQKLLVICKTNYLLPRRWHDVRIDRSKWWKRNKDRHDVEEDKSDLRAIGDCHRGGGCHLCGAEDYDVSQICQEIEHSDDDHGNADGHGHRSGQGMLHLLYHLAECGVTGKCPVSLKHRVAYSKVSK